jgi:hypothetical protein
MNNNRIPFDSYAYKPNPMQAQYLQLDAFRRSQAPVYPRPGAAYIPKNPSSGEASRTVIFVVLGILIVGIVAWLVINFLLYDKNSAWFKVYKAPPPPSGSVQPNGDGTEGTLDPATTTFKNSQLTAYKAGNPSTTPSDFGGYISSP